MRLHLLLLNALCSIWITWAQPFQLSPNAEISALTIGPGQHLNDAFGHNAFRIKDASRGLDVVYGYGRYDFDAPNFYLKFVQGKLNYLISKNNFGDIYQFYVSEDRSIKEQVLNLNQDQKQRLYNYLVNNYKPENRRYLYDFFFDNCATRIKDVAQTATNNRIAFTKTSTYVPKTFRQLLHEHVGKNTWGSFGIDLALGSLVDRTASIEEQMFLPNYIHSTFKASKLNEQPLVKRETIIYNAKTNLGYGGSFLISPILVFSVIGLLIIYVTYKDSKRNARSKWLDVILFSITGFAGIVLLLLWFATDHSVTGYNYNLLWAFPFNLLLIFQLSKSAPKRWVKGYLKFLLIMLTLMTLHWFMGIQVFALGLIPLLLALVYRYVFLIRHFGNT